VGDGVEESVLALVTLDFADDEDGVDNQTNDDDAEEDDAEDQEPGAALVKDDPTDVEEDGQRDQTSAQGDEEGDSRGASGDAHGGYSKASVDLGTDRSAMNWIETYSRSLARIFPQGPD